MRWSNLLLLVLNCPIFGSGNPAKLDPFLFWLDPIRSSIVHFRLVHFLSQTWTYPFLQNSPVSFGQKRHFSITTRALLLLLLSCFSRVQLCATPYMAAHQAPLSLGFSRQGHWSGLPFPSPMHESEKWKWSRSVVSDPQRPHGLQPTRLLRPWDLPGKSTGVGCHCLLQQALANSNKC